jgi:hypothetical protein
MDLFVSQEETREGTRRWLRLNHLADGIEPEIAIYFDLIGERDIRLPPFLDGFVQAILFFAMQSGQSIRAHGVMSRQVLINLRELQEFWCTLRPFDYQHVEIIPDEIVDYPRIDAPARAIAAFSGGVDSTFTLLRHRVKQWSNASLPIDTALLVQHDPMISAGDHSKLIDRVQPLIDDLGVSLKVLRTNLRQASTQKFNDSHGAQLSACLHNYSYQFDYAVLASTQPYQSMVIPWGSTPATDHLLSTPLMRVFHDGAAFSRTEKIIALARYSIARRTIQVCWHKQDENCGLCPKCLRTRLNFLAAGIEDPPCFPGKLDLALIDTIPILDDVSRNELQAILDFADRQGNTGEWVSRLRHRLAATTESKQLGQENVGQPTQDNVLHSEQLAATLQYVKWERDELLKSTSWRLTAPIRAVASALRNLRGGS